MIKRTIEISSGPAKLSLKLDQMILDREGFECVTIPCEDIGVLIIDHPAVSYTHGLINKLLECETAIIVCDSKHLPAGLLLPMSANTLQGERLRQQASVKVPVRKQLWKQIIQAKIRHQAQVFGEDHPDFAKIRNLAYRVRSGDPGNVEALASRIYWQALFAGEKFKRLTDGGGANDLLNYGYTILRSAVARAICASGLHPSLSLHHKNKYNSYALADDLMEPFRPMVDVRVKQLWASGRQTIDRETKTVLLGMLTDTVKAGGTTGPFMVNLPRMTASLCQCFAGEKKEMEIPVPWNFQDTEACGS
ncbi:MAG: type II CRISPR-associated endonuclease Cas1 [Phycisphaerae bacterium]|jgi:CRISPR-associated protein Cas1|nr:type II CRISPR-associated endonuclease Cas1 [Phycisphaerae bacterium]